MGVGPMGRYWLSDKGWAEYKEAEKARRERAVAGPRPVHVDPEEEISDLVSHLAEEIPRKDAVAFVRGWQLIFGDTETRLPQEDGYAIERRDSIVDIALAIWFPADRIMAAAFGPEWYDTLRQGQRQEEFARIRKEVAEWLRTVEETLP